MNDIEIRKETNYHAHAVKGYLQFERETLERITQLESQWMATSATSQRVNLSNQIEQLLGRIILTYENYPQLKSDSTVTRLMDELAGTENRISVARTCYNDGVRNYDTISGQFRTIYLMKMAHQSQSINLTDLGP